MGAMLSFVPGVLRMFGGGLGFLADKSDKNPKSAAGLSVVGGLLTLFGVSPSSLHAVGGVMVTMGEMLKGFGWTPSAASPRCQKVAAIGSKRATVC